MGTFHHLHFSGVSSPVIALGAVFSGLEVPLVIIGFEARENIRPATLPPRSATGTGLNKWPST
jgi:nitric oxide reductase large subunit